MKKRRVMKLRVNLMAYSLFLGITGLVAGSASLIKDVKRQELENEKEFNYYLEEYKNSIEPLEEKIVVELEETEAKMEDEITSVAIFNNKEDLYLPDTNEYVTEKKLLNTDSFELTTDNKTFEELDPENFVLFTAVVAAESTNDRYDALATASSIVNRCDCDRWVDYVNSLGKDGENPIDQLTLSGQYEAYFNGNYKKYLNGTCEIPQDVLIACEAVWFKGIRNNNYCSFRAAESKSYSDNQIVEGGNRFNDEMEPVKIYY